LDKNLSPALEAKFDKTLTKVSTSWNLSEFQRDLSNESIRFVDVPGAQWEGWVRQQFANRPRMELDLASQTVNKFNTEWREGRVTVKYRADDTKTSEDDAELLNGLFRKDYRRCNGTQATDCAVGEMSKGGVGGIKLRTDYLVPDDPDNFDQTIKFEPIYNAYNTMVFDANAKAQDKSDAEWGALIVTYTKEAFEEAYPDKALENFFVPQNRNVFNLNDLHLVYVCEYYEKVTKREMAYRFIQEKTGEKRTIYKSDLDEELIIAMADSGFNKTSERRIQRTTVEKSILYGGGYLSKPKRIPGHRLPIAPCYGYGSYVDGQQYFYGLVEKLKDAQRLSNMAVSNMAMNAATSPNSMPILTPEQVAGHEQRWSEQHLGKHAYAILNSVDDEGNPIPLGPIQYTKPTQIDPNTTMLMQTSQGFIQQATGGMPQDTIDPDSSGKAINAMLGQVDLQTGILRDNISQFFQSVGDIYLGMASEIYDDERFVKVTNMDGSDKSVLLKQYVLHPKMNKFIRINDISQMKLEVMVDTGPAFATRKRETVDVLNQVMEKTDPASPYFPLVYGGIIENLEGPGLDSLKKFNKDQLILQGHKEPETDEEIEMVQQAQQAQDDGGQEAALIENIQSQTALNMANAEDKKSEIAKQNAETQKIMVETESQRIENQMVQSGIAELVGG
jgi:hypothetical protein